MCIRDSTTSSSFIAMRNSPTEIDAAEKYPHDKNREIREKARQHNI